MRRGGLLERWRDHVERQARSGLSARAWCEREGVSAHSFYAWRRRLESRGDDVEPAAFVPVRLAEEPGPCPSGIELAVDGRVRIMVGCEFDAGVLRRVLEVLGAC